MLFNSYEFIFGFLPFVFIFFYVIARRNHFAAAGWLGLASLVFYGYWSVKALPLLLISIFVNYWLGVLLSSPEPSLNQNRRFFLITGLVVNLGVLATFKYTNFLIDNINFTLGLFRYKQIPLLNIILPIGISFFTFTQIAFLVDCYRGKVKERNFIHYLLFVSYFPHLIAGPVLHHAQMMPQFGKKETYAIDHKKVAFGMTIFTVGLAKKLLIADLLGEYADAFFNGVKSGLSPQLFMSWFGVWAYTFQIYFDFSGYSDMAIGLSLLFGIKLPINFNSPYKATSIIDFWRRWHISLSTFLRDYLYFPLGGNRLGKFRRHINLFATMVLGGLWHGASWTFVLWGTLHGAYLILNHTWRSSPFAKHFESYFGRRLGWLITFTCVCFAWVLFRSDSIASAQSIFLGMFGTNGISLPSQLETVTAIADLAGQWGVNFTQQLTPKEVGTTRIFLLTLFAMLMAFLAPSSTRLLNLADSRSFEAKEHRFIWLSFPMALLLAVCITHLQRDSAFLYFQF